MMYSLFSHFIQYGLKRNTHDIILFICNFCYKLTALFICYFFFIITLTLLFNLIFIPILLLLWILKYTTSHNMFFFYDYNIIGYLVTFLYRIFKSFFTNVSAFGILLTYDVYVLFFKYYSYIEYYFQEEISNLCIFLIIGILILSIFIFDIISSLPMYLLDEEDDTFEENKKLMYYIKLSRNRYVFIHGIGLCILMYFIFPYIYIQYILLPILEYVLSVYETLYIFIEFYSKLLLEDTPRIIISSFDSDIERYLLFQLLPLPYVDIFNQSIITKNIYYWDRYYYQFFENNSSLKYVYADLNYVLNYCDVNQLSYEDEQMQTLLTKIYDSDLIIDYDGYISDGFVHLDERVNDLLYLYKKKKEFLH